MAELTQEQRDGILQLAQSDTWTGVPYVLGGSYTPGGIKALGTDCSNFVLVCYKQFVDGLPADMAVANFRNSPLFATIPPNEAKNGDIIVFPKYDHPNYGQLADHMGILLDRTNKIFIGAQSSTGVKTRPFGPENLHWFSRPREFVRLGNILNG